MAAAHPFGSFVGCRFKRIGIARLQETISQCALTLCHAVLRVLRLRALVGPVLRPPASQCAPGLMVGRPPQVHTDGFFYLLVCLQAAVTCFVDHLRAAQHFQRNYVHFRCTDGGTLDLPPHTAQCSRPVVTTPFVCVMWPSSLHSRSDEPHYIVN